MPERNKDDDEGVRIIGYSSKLLGRLKGSWRREEVKHSKIKKERRKEIERGRAEWKMKKVRREMTA